jgi:hypothetical protein
MKGVDKSLLNMLKNRKLVVVCSAAVLTVALAAVVYSIFFGKTPRDIYFQAEGRNFQRYAGHLKSLYSDFREKHEPYANRRYKTRSEFTFNADAGSEKMFGRADAGRIIDVMKRCKLITDIRNDPQNRKSTANVSLLLERMPVADAEVFTDESRIGFTVPVLTPDIYFLAGLDRIEEVYARFGIPFRLKRVLRSADIAGAIRFDDADYRSAAGRLGQLVSGYIEEKDVRYGERVALRIGNEDIKGREIIVRLDADKTGELIRNITRSAADDDVLMNLIYGNYSDMVKLLQDSGLFSFFDAMGNMDYLNLNERITGLLGKVGAETGGAEHFRSTVRELGERFSVTDGLEMKVVVDKSGNILERRFVLGYRPEGGEERLLEINSAVNDVKNINFNNLAFSVNFTMPGSEREIKSTLLKVNTNILPGKNGGEKGKAEIAYEERKGGATVYNAVLQLDIERGVDELTLRRNDTVNYTAGFWEEGNDDWDRISGRVGIESWKNDKRKTENRKTGIVVKTDMASFDMGSATLEFNIVTENMFDIEEFSLPDTARYRTVNLNTASDAELAGIQEELMASFGAFYISNKSIFDAIMP